MRGVAIGSSTRRPPSERRAMKRSTVLLVAGSLLTTGTLARASWFLSRSEPSARFRTAVVERTDVVSSITATGTLVPEDVVDVGAQVNGQIASFGSDADGGPVDFRSRVAQGMVLARIDEALFDADVAAAGAQAQVSVAEANRNQAAAKVDEAEREWKRTQELSDSKVVAIADSDLARSNLEQARAALAQADASIVLSRAAVTSAEATLSRAQRNLAYCTIRSPVDGVILDRRVEIGQTVVASLNAPSLFLIAKDLRRMTVLVQVNEADITHVQPGEPVTFTVDARPQSVYRGVVRKVRLNATLTQNVVTYTVEIAADNPGLELLPYLTADVTFEVARHEGVLAVPGAALRWEPPGAREPEAGNGKTREPGASSVWIVKDGQPSALPVRAVLADGTRTEIEGEGISEGLPVIVGEAVADAPAAKDANPFAPSLARRAR